LDTPYSDLESFTGLRPLVVTLLPENAFQAYKLKQQAAGAELEHLKPPHNNPADDTINFLLNTPARVAVSEPEKVEA
ncbi:MAG: GH3 auxin-responsive promoter, partial [Dehalococcoidales bacterium]|nr:GH3 auxin-responsive promoter [Dehalococcoidales bacterium]